MVTLAIPTESAVRVEGPPQGQWTRADWERLPDDGNRYEIIEGVVYMSTSPSAFHQWILQNLYDRVGLPAKQSGRAFPFFAPIGVFMPGCDPVQPDLILILSENAGIIHDRRIYGIPDVIAEILSPGNAEYDEAIKHKAYESAGVPEYAIIDPKARALRYYRLQADGTFGEPHLFSADDLFAFACLPEIQFRVGDLFAGAPDTTV
ncbi:MAG: Uma2 family endonuclease [Anaerolineae bacterium]|nr:Uma2 family endonuclease [Anaerolineae bacterium]